MYIDIDHKRTRELKQWNKQRNPDNLNSVSTTPQGPGSSNQADKPDNFKLIEEVIENVNSEGTHHQNYWSGSNSQQKQKFFKINGFVSYMKHEDKFFYLSCQDCRRKVVDEVEGYRCENCNKTFTSALPTYIMSAKVQDPSGDVFI